MRKLIFAIMLSAIVLASCSNKQENKEIMESQELTFDIAEGVKTQKVHFKNRFGIELTADLYLPATYNPDQKAPAIAVCGPFGAVKEQTSITGTIKDSKSEKISYRPDGRLADASSKGVVLEANGSTIKKTYRR